MCPARFTPALPLPHLRRWCGALPGHARSLALGLALVFAAQPLRAAEITVFAAASLKTALDAIGADWLAQGGSGLRLTYAGSAQLAKQIEAGAPADLFLSASTDWMDYLAQRGLIDPGSRRDLAGNALVLIAPAADSPDASPAEITPAFDLTARLGTGKLAMALVEAVPAGIYGKQALSTLGLWDAVSAQVAQADNVRAALALVASGEAALGIVYATDAGAEPRVTVAGRFPDRSHDPIRYPVALVNGADPAAAAFLEHLFSSPARALLAAQGFTLPDEGDG